jgi:hypothetical protein
MAKTPLFVHIVLRDGRELVVHTSYPEFIAAVSRGADGAIDIKPSVWLCDKKNINAADLAGLMRRMGDWYYYTVVRNVPDDK